MITATNLTKNFGRFRALDGASFHVGDGEAVALWGANGAGKTTAIRCALGLLRHRGSVRIGGVDVRRDPRAARRQVGYVPQELAFHDDLRVIETMRFYARLRRVQRERIDESLETVELARHARKRVRELSGGMKQRLALALALLSDPAALILDEPTSNLDAAARRDFTALLRAQKRSGKTILFSSHRIDEIEALGDRVVGLDQGRISFECAPGELVRAADLRCTLQVVVPSEQLDEAMRVLRAGGYAASRNGSAVYIETLADRKAEPIIALGAARISVRNFDLSADDHSAQLSGGES
ncbi:MAG: ABC transporter ATP-binding protein [Phycisphaeraceae bacterium]|nr:MAG: ABC transporter ATP-binding protein [Phycisphaeraceae bacterium]